MNPIDKAIAIVAPGWAMRRALERRRLEVLARYEGASTGDRFGGWRTVSSNGPNAETQGALVRLRDRSRDLVRNNWAAARAVSVIQHNVVGSGILPSCNIQELEDLLKEYADSTDCDADGQHNLYGLQSLVMRGVAESGEMLVRRERRKFRSKQMPFQVRVLEPDFLDSDRDGDLGNGRVAVQGVEFDASGKRTGYFLFGSHPGELRSFKDWSSTRIDADDIAHIYRVDRAGQVRGVPWAAPVILKLRDYDEYEDAQLVRQKIAACFSVFVRKMEDGLPAQAGQGGRLQGALIEPGLIEQLGPGEDVSFADPPGVDGYADYARVTLREIAAGYQITYEALTGDLSQTSFASSRLGWLEFQRSIDHWREHMLIMRFLKAWERWFLEGAELAGYDTTGAVITWTSPRREMIDPEKEIKAAMLAVRGGFSSMPAEIRKQGRDFEKVLDEIEQWNGEIDNRGLRLDTDPRSFGAAGAAVREASDG